MAKKAFFCFVFQLLVPEINRPGRRLYFAASDPKGGAVESGVRFFTQPTCHHAPAVYGGIRASEAGEMLKTFFRGRR